MKLQPIFYNICLKLNGLVHRHNMCRFSFHQTFINLTTSAVDDTYCTMGCFTLVVIRNLWLSLLRTKLIFSNLIKHTSKFSLNLSLQNLHLFFLKLQLLTSYTITNKLRYLYTSMNLLKPLKTLALVLQNIL